jgi:hypothetical protein
MRDRLQSHSSIRRSYQKSRKGLFLFVDLALFLSFPFFSFLEGRLRSSPALPLLLLLLLLLPVVTNLCGPSHRQQGKSKRDGERERERRQQHQQQQHHDSIHHA